MPEEQQRYSTFYILRKEGRRRASALKGSGEEEVLTPGPYFLVTIHRWAWGTMHIHPLSKKSLLGQDQIYGIQEEGVQSQCAVHAFVLLAILNQWLF